MNEKPPFFVTWCRAQDAFHTETLDEMLDSNLSNYFDYTENASDWIVVGVADSRREAFELSERLRAKKISFQQPT
jgi:hypothetical protein